MKRQVIFLIITVCVIFAASALPAAEKSDKGAKKEGPIQSVLTMPAKVIAPIVSGGTGDAAQKGKEPVKTEVAKPVKEMTQAEKVADIKETLKNNEEILNFVPGLKKEKDKAGNIFYTFQETKLENLDAGTVEKLFGRVRNEAIRIRTDRFNRQMAAIKRAQQVPAAIGGGGRAGAMRGIPQAPKIPKIPKIQTMPPRPPSIPKTPPRPPQISKIPKIPANTR